VILSTGTFRSRYGVPVRVLVLGAGFGGLELTARLSEEFGSDIDVVLIDRGPGFVFGFAKFDVMFGRSTADDVMHTYAALDKPGVQFVSTTIRSIDPAARRVETDAGEFTGDVLVVALGADLLPEATPGLLEGGHEFYTVAGAFALRDVLAEFPGGRVVVAVTSSPFKCPPAPSECALLMHDLLVARGLRSESSIDLVMPLPVPIPPSPEASAVLLAEFAERGIGWHPNRMVRALDPARSVAMFADGDELAYDLFLGVPRHQVPAVVAESGLTVDGWIPVDPATLETRFPGVYAVGDVTSVGTPKAGVFAEGQAAVVAARIGSVVRGEEPAATYGGRGTCYVEFGAERIAGVEVTFLPGQRPVGSFAAPSVELRAEKSAFGSTRVARWFS
jgi:sulfide:quinone oxidoreductase